MCSDPVSYTHLTGSRAEELLELAKAGTNWRPTFSCPDGSPCKRGDAFLRHDLDCGYGELCKGETCCLDCARAKVSCYACERMCSKAKAARKAQRDEEAAKEAERDAKIQENIQKNVQLRAKRLAAAADAAGLENEASILISEYGRGLTVGKLRDWAAGHFDQDDRLYPSTLNARDFSDPVRLAKDLGCSTDYLLGVKMCIRDRTWTYNISPGLLVKYKRGDLPTYRLRELEEVMVRHVQEALDLRLAGVSALMGKVLSA